MRHGFLGRRFFSALRRLKHRAILRKIDNRAQNLFVGASSTPLLNVIHGGEAT
jgi:hypothetical protein